MSRSLVFHLVARLADLAAFTRQDVGVMGSGSLVIRGFVNSLRCKRVLVHGLRFEGHNVLVMSGFDAFYLRANIPFLKVVPVGGFSNEGTSRSNRPFLFHNFIGNALSSIFHLVDCTLLRFVLDLIIPSLLIPIEYVWTLLNTLIPLLVGTLICSSN